MAREYSIYTTKAGDTFDSIALDFYEEENYSVFIMQLNPDLIGTLIFEYGIQLKIPDIDVKDTSTLPPWKR
ncbi:tail protein X [Clostridium cagae]|uniref:tail protein X n=1 Tax=Clostridium TaxID=1485 RepID=UPI000174E39D|nr:MULTISPECIES: LysM domain-containing protein [Clostridium]ACD52525.1 conserved domain protein [Clostridium botulinum E3 str. Alaska E43]MCR1159300.1 LysM peptidoglycan-binding domain-containing protein [Clostridium botulinum]